MNKHTKLAFLSSLLVGLLSLCAQAAVYPNTFTDAGDAGAIPQRGTAFSVEHLLGGMGSSITSIELILTFNSSASLSGTGSGIQGLLTLGTGTGSPYVSFFPTATSSSGSERIYDMTFSGSPGTGFTGLDPNNTWSLALWDNSSSGIENGLAGWSLDVTAVPEPVNVALGIFGAVFLFQKT